MIHEKFLGEFLKNTVPFHYVPLEDFDPFLLFGNGVDP